MRRRDRDLTLMTMGVVFWALGYGMYYQLLGVYALRLGASRLQLGMLAAVMLSVSAAGMIPGAWAATRYSLRWVIAAVWWITVLAALSYAVAPTWQWLVPGLVLSGFTTANNAAMKVYILLKSGPSRVAGTMGIVFGATQIGFIVAPLAGGFLAARLGMRTVFVISACMFVISSTCVTLIRDVPYHCPGSAPSPRALLANRPFHRYLGFFAVGFLAIYLAQPFVSPFLAQVHGQGYAALGIFAAVASVGGATLSAVMGRAADRWGSRAAIGLLLIVLLAGLALLLIAHTRPVFGVAVLCLGAFDAFRYVAYGVSARSFGGLELAWGYGIFDAVMGIPMTCGALLGGALYRQSYRLPFIVAIGLCAALLASLVLSRGWGRQTAVGFIRRRHAAAKATYHV